MALAKHRGGVGIDDGRYTMKKLWLVGLMFAASCCFGSAAEPLPIRFIRRTMSDRPVPYEEEIKLFPELSLHSFVILSELGYVDRAGQWQKPRPK